MKVQFLQSQVNSIIITTTTLFFLLIFLFPIISYSQEEDENYRECGTPFSCGTFMNLFYPFWSDDRSELCGHPGYKLTCIAGQQPIITIKNEEFRVVSVKQEKSLMTIAREDYWENICPGDFANTTLDQALFNFTQPFPNISLFYNCAHLPSSFPEIILPCYSPNNQRPNAFYATDEKLRELKIERPQCEHRVNVPIPMDALKEILNGVDALSRVLRRGFEVIYEYHQNCRGCHDSGGRCGTNTTTSNFTCLCPDHPYESSCPRKNGTDKNIELKVGIAIGASFGGILITSVIFAIYLRRKKKGPYASSSYVSQMLTNSSDFSSRSDMEKGGSHFGVHLFTYQELETATNNFDSAKELGEGGFGTVYYGTLKDGRSVAVKRLYENNFKRVEQFMNEVDILTRLRHQNLVSLYGCTSRHSRELLLVYEYISNGTVADHLHGERAKPGELPWSTRIKIAVETANALTYLHASDIIHRDVKTNNILLDNNFVVKVADFGLSRLFPMHVTHISTAPQGTPGYVDPEYHQCYQLTDKSDVYSFGVVLIELISSMPAVDITRHRHEINLSNMAINKIQTGALDELVDKNLGYETEYDVRKMINAVAELAFQCLQSAKELRPSMEEVLLTLKEIQTKDYSLEKAEEDDAVGLLKSGPLLLSPDTVMIQWNSSSSTTPNVSG
ncbi:LEAF RUST 10 DISEASE-RESISTANCE LOCUS RECEPTOR-LIKE PROTEIN KINASE-like 1.2 isoform X3 [Mercurialis annua]|uniref:LEAF RUST 10 DISEASE-RESISTANCE LOCUS RECEPTOR-LIKE PROTEIN KINASE-like 1.2 isoform X3 n=1 Tax=Mercurialis annua TaxID=3986 RepID=UPI00216045BD|nr:LEAF RUST 10 DISEASE-RESISTANCE LOCUS RECEPTOR-LIKE PROTEIN KINASE-like 1.2 isoform X3 [Mercurialis annua]